MNPDRRFRAVCRLEHIFAVLFLVGVLSCSSAPIEDNRTEMDQEFDRTSRAARTAFESGRPQQAVNLYTQALERAYILDDLNAIVDSQYNLAVCMTRLKSYVEAFDWVSQSKAELTRRNQRIPADILLLEATIVYRMGRLDEAWQLTDKILRDPSELSGAIQSKTHFLRGLIADEWGDVHQLRHEILSLGKPAEVGLRADREELIGRLALLESSWNEAIEAFDRTAEFRRDDFDYSEMVNALALAAWACERAGKLSEASKRYLRAGRSAARQEKDREALNWLNRAENLAAEAGDEFTVDQARAYRQWLEAP